MYKKFFFKILLFLFLPLFIGMFNLFMDPSHLFDSEQYLKGAVQILNEGKNIANLNNYEDRIMQRSYIKNLNKSKDIIVIGSSRSMQIQNKSFKNFTFFNSSVTEAHLNDFFAIYQLYKEHNLKPKIIIIGVDFWNFSKESNKFNKWEVFNNELKNVDFKLKINEPPFYKSICFEKIKLLFTGEYFTESLRSFKRKNYFPTKEEFIKEPVKMADGSLVYDKAHRERSLIEINEAAQMEILRKNKNRGDYKNIDKKLYGDFINFIEYLVEQKIDVILFLAPIHPDLYKSYIEDSNYSLIITVEKLCKSLSEKYHMQIIGSYNPDNYSLSSSDFYDGSHPKREIVYKIINNSLKNITLPVVLNHPTTL
jgi:hypothetical protein